MEKSLNFLKIFSKFSAFLEQRRKALHADISLEFSLPMEILLQRLMIFLFSATVNGYSPIISRLFQRISNSHSLFKRVLRGLINFSTR